MTSRQVADAATPSTYRRKLVRVGLTAGAAGLCALVLGSLAYAEDKAVDHFFPTSTGAPTGNNADGGLFNTPNDVAFNESTGKFYVVDSGNHRIQRFNADESFDIAWGKDVSESTAGTGFEICTDEEDCKAGLPGAFGGEMSTPQGIAISPTSGDVYVRDRDNRRVQQFTANGGFVRAWGANVDSLAPGTAFEKCEIAANCQAGTNSTGAGEFATAATNFDATGVAISPVNGDLFVIDQGGGATGNRNRRLQQFEGDGDFVRAWGWGVDDGASAFQICTAASSCQAGALGGDGTANGRFGVLANAQPLHVAVDSAGIVYTSDRKTNAGSTTRVMRFDSTVPGDDNAAAAALLLSPVLQESGGGPLLEADANSTTAMEIDPDTDRLFIARALGATSPIQELDLSTEPPTSVDVHMANSGLLARGIGIEPSSGDIFASSTSAGHHRVYVLDDDGAGTPDATVHPALNVGPHSASLSGIVNPRGFPATYRFEYSKNGVTWTAVTGDQALPEVDQDEAVDDELTGLEANTVYKVRLVVTKGFGAGTGTSGEQLLLTSAVPPDVTALPPNHRGATTATLAGLINPNGKATTYYFEYGTGTGYGSRAPVPAASAGSGGTVKDVSRQIAGLQPDTTYHYRLVAENEEGSTPGDDVTFRTRGEAPTPPGGRAYELVSPADETSGTGAGVYLPGDLPAAASGFPSLDGERYAVESSHGPTLVDGAFAYASDFAFADRVSDEVGWVHHSPFTHPNTGYAGNRFAKLDSASDDLSLAQWSSNSSHLSMFPEQADWPATLDAPILGDWEGRWEMFGPTDPAQGNAAVGAGANLISADGSHAVMTSDVKGLTGSGDPTTSQIAGRTTYIDDVSAGLSDAFPGAGIRTPVGVCASGTTVPERLASGKQAAQACAEGALVSGRGASVTAGGGGHVARSAVSRDASRVFFMSPDPRDAPVACSPAIGSDTTCPAQLYVRQENTDGDVLTRWISRSEVADQDATLMGPVYFVGASRDGDKAFFRTSAPLTADDPNGACGAPCTTGAVSNGSWDLYVYDLPNGPDGDPSTPDGDPGGGSLTRISAGPAGTADPNVSPGIITGNEDGAKRPNPLRFLSDDGSRAYFTSADDIPGVQVPNSGTITSPGGSPGDTDTTNLYLYDATRSPADRWEFVAGLPRDTSASIASCASSSPSIGDGVNLSGALTTLVGSTFNCVRGTDDGAFITFMTAGKLTPGDPDVSSGDIYAYDSSTQELTRLSAPQGGAGGSYECLTGGAHAGQRCFGDGGIGWERSLARPRLGVTTDPATPGDRIAFFQSKSPLVAEDDDEAYDVYQWRNGELTLLSVGTSQGAYYNGNSADGRNVFLMTKDRLSWQDTDAEMDVYDARVGGGIPQPPAPRPPCDVLGDRCQGSTPPPVSQPNGTGSGGGGDAAPDLRVVLTVVDLSRKARAAAARRGILPLRVRISAAGQIRAVVKATLGGTSRTVARGSKRMGKAGATTLRLRLSKAARKRLRARKPLRLEASVTAPGAHRQETSTVLKRPGR